MHEQRLLTGLFETEEGAEKAMRALLDQDFPMDYVSVLGKAQRSGDDPIGIYHHSVGERARSWGAMGAFWGGLLGLVSGAAGLFVLPGIGAVMAAGPVVEAIAGTAAGAGVGGGAMAGAGALTQLVSGLRRMGIPDEKIDALREAIGEGRTIVMARVEPGEAGRWRAELESAGAREVFDLPFQSLS